MKQSAKFLAFLAAAIALPAAPPAAADKKPTTQPAATRPARPKKPSRWEGHIRRFEAGDKKNPPPKGAALFLGSSSIVHWNTKKWFPRHVTINRGFGGSQVADSLQFAERILTPYQPRIVVFYAGDNDIAARKTPERVLADYKALVAKARAKLPKVTFVFVAIKPSLRRWKLWPKMKQANELIEKFSRSDPRLLYLDIAKPMLGADGIPRKELFVKDGLHLSAKGYELWTSLVLPHLGKPDKPAPAKP